MSAFCAPTQRFRVLSTEAELEELQGRQKEVKECRERLRAKQAMDYFSVSTRECGFCGSLLLESEPDYFCCGEGHRQHFPWQSLLPNNEISAFCTSY